MCRRFVRVVAASVCSACLTLSTAAAAAPDDADAGAVPAPGASAAEPPRVPATPAPPPANGEPPPGGAQAKDDLHGEAPFKWTLVPGLHVQLDGFGSLGPGVSRYQRADGSQLAPTFDVHRIRPSFAGTFGDHFSYYVLLEFGVSNIGGPGQTFAFRGGDVFAWVDYAFSDALKIRFGQYPVPLMWENIRPLATWDFMEAARTESIVCPLACTDLGLMVFGAHGPLAYGVGLFNGEGRNRTNADGLGDVDGRVSVAVNEKSTTRAKFGVSGRHGLVDPKSSWGDAFAGGFATSRGYQYWNPIYSLNTAVPTEVHVLPSSRQNAVEADVVLEIGNFDIQAEGAYVDYGRREVTRAAPEIEETLRSGALTGLSYYVTANLWLLPPSKTLKAQRWNEALFKGRVPKSEEANRPSLQFLVRWEQQILNYDSISRSSGPVDRGFLDLYTPHIRADMIMTNLSLWVTSHFRLAAEWDMYYFPGGNVDSDPRRVTNQALAPGAVIPGERGSIRPVELPPEVTPWNNPSYFQPASPKARTLHEISARVQYSF